MQKYSETTYTKNENEEIEKIKKFIQELEEKKIEEINRQNLEVVKHYNEFSFGKFKLEDVYVVISENENKQKIYEVYLESTGNKILRINSETEELVIDENVKPLFTINDLSKEEIEQYILNNKEKLKIKLERISEEELKTELEKQENKKGKETTREENDENKDKKLNKKEKIEKDLKNNNMQNTDLKISFYKKVVDERMTSEFPEIAVGAKEIGIAYSETLGGFVCVVETDKGFKIADGTEVSRPTMKTVISIDEKGDNIEERIPHALIETKNKEIAINFEQYGYVGIEKIDRTQSDYRVGRKIETQGDSKEVDEDIKRITEYGGTHKMEDVAQNYKKQKEMGDKEIKIEELTGEEEIVINTTSGNDINIAEEASKAKVSEKEFLEFYENAEGQTPEEKVENAHEDLEEYYRNPGRRPRQ